MLLGHPVDVSAEVERNVRHIQGRACPRGLLQIRKSLFRLQHSLQESRGGRICQIEKTTLVWKYSRQILHWEAVMTRWHRRMCCEYAFVAHLLDIFPAN